GSLRSWERRRPPLEKGPKHGRSSAGATPPWVAADVSHPRGRLLGPCPAWSRARNYRDCTSLPKALSDSRVRRRAWENPSQKSPSVCWPAQPDSPKKAAIMSLHYNEI